MFTLLHSVHWVITPSSKTPLPSFLPSPPLKSANCPNLPFLGNPPSISVFFCEVPPLKLDLVSEHPKY